MAEKTTCRDIRVGPNKDIKVTEKIVCRNTVCGLNKDGICSQNAKCSRWY